MSYVDRYRHFDVLLGKTLVSVENREDEELVFTTDDGEVYRQYHQQSCCESVYVESIVGDLNDLIGSPILVAEEVTSNENPPDAKESETEYQDSFTWSLYKLATRKGYVDIRWYGSSNGYYGEEVDLVKDEPSEDE